MNAPLGDRRSAFRTAIERFLQARRDTKLDKLAPDDPKRDELIAQFTPEAWIDDAARRVGQIQAVTHSLKATHPDARGTSLYQQPDQLPGRAEVGSHVLGQDFAGDVVGNAAALDVYKFLRVTVENRSLLDWMLAAAWLGRHACSGQAAVLADRRRCGRRCAIPPACAAVCQLAGASRL
jgi:CRISPR-associated protein Csy1